MYVFISNFLSSFSILLSVSFSYALRFLLFTFLQFFFLDSLSTSYCIGSSSEIDDHFFRVRTCTVRSKVCTLNRRYFLILFLTFLYSHILPLSLWRNFVLQWLLYIFENDIHNNVICFAFLFHLLISSISSTSNLWIWFF